MLLVNPVSMAKKTKNNEQVATHIVYLTATSPLRGCRQFCNNTKRVWRLSHSPCGLWIACVYRQEHTLMGPA